MCVICARRWRCAGGVWRQKAAALTLLAHSYIQFFATADAADASSFSAHSPFFDTENIQTAVRLQRTTTTTTVFKLMAK